jgi:hypothetical protein
LILIPRHPPIRVVTSYRDEERPEPDALGRPGIRGVEREIDADVEVQMTGVAAGAWLEEHSAASRPSFSSQDSMMHVRKIAGVVKQQRRHLDHQPSLTAVQRRGRPGAFALSPRRPE